MSDQGFKNHMINTSHWVVNGVIALGSGTMRYDLSGLGITAHEAIGANIGVRFVSDGSTGVKIALPTADGDKVAAVTPKAYALGDTIDDLWVPGALCNITIGHTNLTGARSDGTIAYGITVMSDGRFKATASGDQYQGVALYGGNGGAIGDVIPGILYNHIGISESGG